MGCGAPEAVVEPDEAPIEPSDASAPEAAERAGAGTAALHACE